MDSLDEEGPLAPEARRMKWHPEALAPSQKLALRDLGGIAEARGFYLAGGTAVALYLGHRLSVDLDWFTDGRIEDESRLAGQLREAAPRLAVEKLSRQALNCSVRNVRCSFIALPYRLMRPTLELPGFGCRIAALDDLAAMKLAAVAQRGARKDFIDVFALAREHRPLGELVRLYERRHGFAGSAHLMNALVYFDDAEGDPMPRMLWKIRWGKVKDSIRGWVRRMAMEDRRG